jgi:hypothetical protein
MGLLIEEFFGKFSEYTNDMGFFTNLAIKAVLLFLLLGAFFLAIWSIYSKNYFIMLGIIGLYLLAETAHFIRKSREAVMKDEQNRQIARELLNPEKSKNKVFLNKPNVIQNVKGKKILIESSSPVKHDVDTSPIRTKISINKGLLERKKGNSNLLGLNKSKNNGLLKKGSKKRISR